MLAYAAKARSQCGGQARHTLSETGHSTVKPALDALQLDAYCMAVPITLAMGATALPAVNDGQHQRSARSCANVVPSLWAAHCRRIHTTRVPSCSGR